MATRRRAVRAIIGIIIGIVVAVVLIDAAWSLAGQWFPAPVDVDGGTVAMLATYVMQMPVAGQLLIVAGWLVAGYVAAFAALRLSQWRPAGWIVAIAIVLLGLWNMTQLTMPWWMLAANVVAPIAGTWLAERQFHRARPGDPLIE